MAPADADIVNMFFEARKRAEQIGAEVDTLGSNFVVDVKGSNAVFQQVTQVMAYLNGYIDGSGKSDDES